MGGVSTLILETKLKRVLYSSHSISIGVLQKGQKELDNFTGSEKDIRIEIEIECMKKKNISYMYLSCYCPRQTDNSMK